MTDREMEVDLLLEAIHRKFHYDFRHYAPQSLFRRIESALERFQCKTVSQLQNRVVHDSGFFESLLQYLTVGTTEMFRDPGYFLAMRRQVIPVLHRFPTVRVWVAGCSSGEEVYSWCILLKEEGLLDRSIIYATDINPAALARATAGIYPTSDVQGYSANYLDAGGQSSLSDYYVAAYDAVKFDRSLVRSVVFADHSLVTDGAFAEVQVISCRNVLIYFGGRNKARALGLFRDSLCPGGILGLGSQETLQFSTVEGAFEIQDEGQRIFRKRRA